MTKPYLSHLQEYFDAGRLSYRTTVRGDHEYAIVCYTKDQFFNHEWDDITIKHRGVIYRDDGKVINSPFEKVFNLNEHSSTGVMEVEAMMKSRCYEVLDKVNGHLVIVSCDTDYNEVFVTTKGSFGGDLAISDEQLIKDMGIYDTVKRMNAPLTLMFECVADYDKHMHFEKALKQYSPDGKNTMVLLGAQSQTEHHEYDVLKAYAETLNCPVVERYTDLEQGELEELFKHKGIEGYVFNFTGDQSFKVKIKTEEYVALRYLKDLNAELFANRLYNSGVQGMFNSYDEELFPVCRALMKDFEQFIEDEMSKVDSKAIEGMSKKDIANDGRLSSIQKALLLGTRMDALMNSKSVRKAFKASDYRDNVNATIKQFVQGALQAA